MILYFFLFLILVFTFLSFLKPSGFDIMGFSSINTFFNYSRIVCAIVIVCLYARNHERNKLLHYFLLYFLYCCVSTYLGGYGDTNKIFIFSGSSIAFAMIFYILKKEYFKLAIQALLSVYMVLIVFSFFWLYKYVGFVINIEEHFSEEELQFAYFLSSSNGSASYFIPAMTMAVLNLYISGKRNLLSWITIFFTYCSGLIIWSATSLVAETVLLLYALCVFFDKTYVIKRFLRPKILVILCLCISVGITFFKIQYLFEFIIVDILHKDLTMTGRTTIWDNGFNAFFSSTITGIGNINDIVRTCDNCYAQLLGDSGLIGFFIFTSMMVFVYKSLTKSVNGEVVFLFLITYALLLLMFVAESWSQFFGLYVLLVLFSKADFIQNYINSKTYE